MFEGVTAATIFGQCGIAVVGMSLLVEYHVFDDRTGSDRVPNNGFIFLA